MKKHKISINVTGESGSGKTSIVQLIADTLRHYGIEATTRHSATESEDHVRESMVQRLHQLKNKCSITLTEQGINYPSYRYNHPQAIVSNLSDAVDVQQEQLEFPVRITPLGDDRFVSQVADTRSDFVSICTEELANSPTHEILLESEAI